MISDEQYLERNRRTLIVVKYFIENNYPSILEIEAKTGIPKSSVQRYLNDHKLIIELLGPDIATEVENAIKRNYLLARIKGGNKSIENNSPIKDNEGHFNGSSKR